MSLRSLPRRDRRAALALATRTAALLTLLAPATAHAQSAIIYGSLGNFDISNDTGRVCHGFEVEADGLAPQQIVGSFSANRYGAPDVTPTPTGVKVTWLSPRASDGSWATRTLPHTVPWFPGQCYQWTPGTYEASGCEHFGTSAIANPTRVKSRWLCEDTSDPRVLVAVDPPTAVPMPTYYVQPPAQVGAPAQLVMEVEAPEPAEAPDQYGDAQWMRVYRMELPRPLTLDELVADNPNAVPMDPTQLEADYQIVQDEPLAGGSGNRRRKRNGSDIAPTTRAIVRRIEMFRYTGAYDPVTHEAVCADILCNVPAPEEMGELISVQMTAANVQPDAVLVTNAGGGRVTSLDRAIDCGNKCAAPYDANTLVTLTAEPDSNMTFAGWTGACAGTNASCNVTVNSGVAVGARFTANPVAASSALTLKIGGKGTVTSLPAGISCGTACTASFVNGTVVTLTAAPQPRFKFTGWSGGGCSGTNPTCTITVSAATQVKANFKK